MSINSIYSGNVQNYLKSSNISTISNESLSKSQSVMSTKKNEGAYKLSISSEAKDEGVLASRTKKVIQEKIERDKANKLEEMVIGK